MTFENSLAPDKWSGSKLFDTLPDGIPEWIFGKKNDFEKISRWYIIKSMNNFPVDKVLKEVPITTALGDTIVWPWPQGQRSNNLSSCKCIS